MRFNNKYVLLAALCMTILVGSCKKWDKHNELNDPGLGKDLFVQVSENSNLSKFAELLIKSGYDKVIASSKTFTVFAPTNAALASLDAAIVNDSAKLSQFVGNHIATQSYFTSAASTQIRIAMLNGKYNNLLGKKFDDANITDPDHAAKNGVLHVIDQMVPALPNCWETLENNPAIPAKQKAYMLSLFQNVYDLTNAVQIGVDPITGAPIYQPGTDSVRTNIFWKSVHDLRNESKEYTFFVLTDATFDSEVNKFKIYYSTSTVDSTTKLTSFDVVKDLSFDTKYLPTTVPDTILSKFGVKVPVERPAIVQTIKTSNGIVYIMSKANVQPIHKLKSFYLEGENYRSQSVDRRSNTYFRDRYNPLTNQDFKDVLVNGHGVALFNLGYRVSAANSVKYRAYWVALNDFQTVTFQQKLSIGSPAAVDLPYTTVPLNSFSEVYLGEFTLAKYVSTLDLYLVAANSTTANVNPLVCDYIRLVPVP